MIHFRSNYHIGARALTKGMHILILLSFLFAKSLLAKTYYVDPGRGNDAGLGTLATPWRTIAKANATLRAGDTVFLRGGEYNADVIRPANSGTVGNEIVYIGYPGETAVITNAKAAGGANGVAIILDNRSYIVVKGVKVDGKQIYTSSNVRRWVSMVGTFYCVIESSSFLFAEGYYGIMLDGGSAFNKFLNNTIDYCGIWNKEGKNYPVSSATNPDYGDAMTIRCAKYNLIEGNVFKHGGHDLLSVEDRYNVIRNNVFDGDWSDWGGSGSNIGSRAASFSARPRFNCEGGYSADKSKSGGFNLIEGNVFKNSRRQDNNQWMAVKIDGVNQIVRRNMFINNAGYGFISMPHEDWPYSSNHKIYNNIIAHHEQMGFQLRDLAKKDGNTPIEISNIIIKNNILFNNRLNPNNQNNSSLHDNDFVISITNLGGPYNGISFHNNLIFNPAKLPMVNVYQSGGRQSLAWYHVNRGQNVFSNISASPNFESALEINPKNLANAKIASSSPAIDAGDFLTRAVGSGSGRVIKVLDAGYFFDGFGIVEGDMLQVGKNAPVRITKVDYATNTITLAGSIAWGDKDPVSLPYVGNAPDIGAYEYDPYNGGGGGSDIVRTLYFVDPVGGNDANDGSQGKPWKTLTKANATLTPGDTVYLRAGEYTGQVIRPAASGQAGKPIHYLAFSGEKPVLTNAKASGGTAINLDDRSYIIVRGIEVDGKAAFKNANVLRWLSMSNTSHSTISNCRFQYAEGPEGALLSNDSQYNKVLNNTFDHSGAWNDGSGKPVGVLLSVQCASFNTIEGNQFLRGGNALLYVAGERNAIRRNQFDNSWGMNGTEKLGGHGVILTHSPTRSCNNSIGGNNLFEGNHIKNTWKRSDGSWAKALEVEGEGQVVRQNYIFEAVEGIIGHLNTGAPIARFNRIYHNTVVSRDGWSFVHELSAEDSRANVLKNNIAITTDGQRPHIAWNVVADGNGSFNGSQFVNNCFFSAPTDSIEEMYVEGVGKAMIGQLEAEHRQEVFGNLSRDPRFVRSAMSSVEDLHLDYYSPLVDAGEPLTSTVSSGSGSVVQVADARYFTNGFGIVPGDQIQIGSNTVAEVTQVDHSTNRITVNRSISWSANAPVSLVFKGTRPDVGAFETDILTHIDIGK